MMYETALRRCLAEICEFKVNPELDSHKIIQAKFVTKSGDFDTGEEGAFVDAEDFTDSEAEDPTKITVKM